MRIQAYKNEEEHQYEILRKDDGSIWVWNHLTQKYTDKHILRESDLKKNEIDLPHLDNMYSESPEQDHAVHPTDMIEINLYHLFPMVATWEQTPLSTILLGLDWADVLHSQLQDIKLRYSRFLPPANPDIIISTGSYIGGYPIDMSAHQIKYRIPLADKRHLMNTSIVTRTYDPNINYKGLSYREFTDLGGKV
jgi:hypothetical protein